MKIAIDLRSLSSGSISGVENYCLNLLDNLLEIDKKNQYVLFYNAFSPLNLGYFHFVNSQTRRTRWPNKILNIGLKTGLLNLQNLAGEFDIFFMPNLNQYNFKGKTKLVITVHDLSPVVTPEFYDLKRRLWHKSLNYQKAFKSADLLFAMSEYTKQDLIKLFSISPEKIKVIYPAVDHSLFNPLIPIAELRAIRNRYELPGQYLLFLNTVEPRKNLKTLIKAFEKLNSPAYLVIAGKLGWKYKSDFEAIKKSKKNVKIKYIGYIKESDKPGIIKMADALIYPSFYEGFGFQPLEAMAIGTPVISSQITSLPEVVQDSALLVNPYDSEELTQAMQKILNEKNLKEILKEKGERRAENFNWRQSAQQVLENFNNLYL